MKTADDHSITEPPYEAQAFPDGPIFEDSLIDHAKRKRQIVSVFLIYGVLLGVVDGLNGGFLLLSGPSRLVTAAIPVLMLISWVNHDSIERGQPISFGSKATLALSAGLFFVIYCFRSRGYKGLLLLAGGVLLVFTSAFLSVVTVFTGAAIGLWPPPQS